MVFIDHKAASEVAANSKEAILKEHQITESIREADRLANLNGHPARSDLYVRFVATRSISNCFCQSAELGCGCIELWVGALSVEELLPLGSRFLTDLSPTNRAVSTSLPPQFFQLSGKRYLISRERKLLLKC